MARSDVVLCAPVRTAIGTYGGALKALPATELGAAVIQAAIERAGLQGSDIDTVVMGQVVQAGAKMNPARQAMIAAGIPLTVPALKPARQEVDREREAVHFREERNQESAEGAKGPPVTACLRLEKAVGEQDEDGRIDEH